MRTSSIESENDVQLSNAGDEQGAEGPVRGSGIEMTMGRWFPGHH
jgi:hypothetical protein